MIRKLYANYNLIIEVYNIIINLQINKVIEKGERLKRNLI